MAKSPLTMTPLLIRVLPCKWIFCVPHNTERRLTRFPVAVSMYSPLLLMLECELALQERLKLMLRAKLKQLDGLTAAKYVYVSAFE